MNNENNGINKIAKNTYSSFSYQWNKFGNIYPEYITNWTDYTPRSINKKFFEGKVGLDIGCGFCRYTYAAASNNAEVIGCDLSEAVVAAFNNTKNYPNIHIVQADLYNLPFKNEFIDFIFSLGVLHHLPEPEKGFNSLADFLKKDKEIFIWCYDDNKHLKNIFYEILRKITTKINYKILSLLCLFFAVLIRIFFNYPVNIFKKLFSIRQLADLRKRIL
mgnify:CR=1 FL=1